MTNDIATRVIRTREEIEEIRPLWAAWGHHPNADIDFYLEILRLRTTVLRPHIIVIYRNGIPEAMSIGRLERGQIQCNIGYKTVCAPSLRVLNIVYGGLLGTWSEQNGQAMLKQVVADLKKNEADVARFHFVRADSAIYPLILSHSAIGQKDRFPVIQAHRAMELPATIDEVYSGLSRDHRWEIRKKSKKLLGDHPDAHVDCLSKADDLNRIFRDAEEVAQQTYQRGLGVGFIDNAEMRELVNLEIQKGWHRTYILYVDTKPCAFWIGNVYDGTFHSSHLGYHSTYEKYSPGTFLLVKVIEELLREGVKEIDFGLGDARYKERFGNRSWDEVATHIFAPNLKALAVNAIRTPTATVDRLMRRTLQDSALLPRIKRIWRDRRRKANQSREEKVAKGLATDRPRKAQPKVSVVTESTST